MDANELRHMAETLGLNPALFGVEEVDVAKKVSDANEGLELIREKFKGDDADVFAAHSMLDFAHDWVKFLANLTDGIEHEKTGPSSPIMRVVSEFNENVRQMIDYLSEFGDQRERGANGLRASLVEDDEPEAALDDDIPTGVRTQEPLHGRIGEPKDI